MKYPIILVKASRLYTPHTIPSFLPSYPSRQPPSLQHAYLKEDAPLPAAFRKLRQASNSIQVMLQLDLALPQKIGVESPEPFLDGQTPRKTREGPTEGFVEGRKVVEAPDDGPGLVP